MVAVSFWEWYVRPLAFRVNRGATDEKLVLIHDVQSYVYTIASPAAVQLAKAERMVAC
jgi:hypothetical protein